MPNLMIRRGAEGPSFIARNIAGLGLLQLTSAQTVRFGILSIVPAMSVLLYLCRLAVAAAFAQGRAVYRPTALDLSRCLL
jgi:hypothetical protein